MQRNLIIPNPQNLENLKSSIQKDGPENFHVLADFDQTLTQAFVDGQLVPTLISILRDGNYLIPGYAEKAKALFAKYHPIEIDPNVPPGEKKKAMHEWWSTHFKLLIDSGLNKKDIEAIVNSGKIKLRDGFREFLALLRDRGVPLVIMSSTGLGGDAISMLFLKEGVSRENIYIIANSFLWDEKGNATKIEEPIIHGLNKRETTLQNYPIFEVIKNRKNVLLLGNSLGDLGMVEGFDYKNLLKIGFLNEKVEENLENFKKNFDAVLLGDPGMEYINNLLKEIFS